MATKIRKSIFETNSSSMHSLSIGNKPINLEPDPNYAETIILGVGEYGWSGPDLTTWLEKADYLATNTDSSSSKWEMLLAAIHRQYPNLVLEYSDNGYTDHQSFDKCWYELTSTDEIYNFLFGNSIIEIDNDNN